ncbi:trimeric LpxA-like protein [Glomus cerebriforme]|uniref:Dynactin subunit 6 n=1 Tax=Glomus cerebriforme TaxID=658196 RepID=A0A397TIF6_9GLOM|nr:trimeric LpxA-like protein [Glomus cerebriforme]
MCSVKLFSNAHTVFSLCRGEHLKNLNIGKGAVVCNDIEVKGDIQIGTILHPQCKILAVGGPIIFGQNNIIEENVTIINNHHDFHELEIIQINYVEGTKIGSRNIIEAKARILGNTSLGDNCVIGAVCSTKKDEIIPDNTVIFGDHHNRRTQTASANQQSSLHTRHLDYLREVLPKFNHVASDSQEVVPHSTHSRKTKQTASH